MSVSVGKLTIDRRKSGDEGCKRSSMPLFLSFFEKKVAIMQEMWYNTRIGILFLFRGKSRIAGFQTVARKDVL